MQYKIFNLNLFKKMIDSKKELLESALIIQNEIIRIHPLDFLYLQNKSGSCSEKEGLYYIYGLTISIDDAAPFINDLTTVTL